MLSSTNVKISLALSGAILLVVIAFIFVAVMQAPSPAAAPGQERPSQTTESVLQADTHILDNAGEGAVTLVEFLDFECEACGAFYPVVEDLREEFAGEVTFAFRYFPLPGHTNSVNAAIAVEAAAQQGRLEDMFARMYETQIEWGESQESKAALFRQFAGELGLDLVAYDAAVAAPETLERVMADFDAGVALGVQSTPTFFLNDRPVQLSSFDDLRTAIEAELQ
ncbi:DsbA family protein [Microcella frigidaquae]|uniref:Protein-disulfide isomerase n=1 Tax=Microcella frigidaquae TaxID=424758 RepID=A0A840X7Q6_9MICO|nr:thioredoxin domain-containing protein [Microcella frigidaquae]MBB5618271.1 protein-disulfide isomerase [Microcella frigidaquae]NHN45949.1 thioredoxin domain-containing protein [Microcella frigidaquae]